MLQVKEKIPEMWERLGYLMDHNEDRQQDAELWGTYRDHVNRSDSQPARQPASQPDRQAASLPARSNYRL